MKVTWQAFLFSIGFIAKDGRTCRTCSVLTPECAGGYKCSSNVTCVFTLHGLRDRWFMTMCNFVQNTSMNMFALNEAMDKHNFFVCV